MDKQILKTIIIKHERILSKIYRFLCMNKTSIKKRNRVIWGNAFMSHCKIKIVGERNYLYIGGKVSRLKSTSISVYGSDNIIMIGDSCNLIDAHLHIEDNGGKIQIKNHVTISGYSELAVIEGRRIEIGEDCLFSNHIIMRTGDSHSIIDSSTGSRINPSKDIIIGDHVWVGHDVKLLKGVKVGDNSVIATGSILSNDEYPANSVIGGVGKGRVLKSGINWDSKRI